MKRPFSSKRKKLIKYFSNLSLILVVFVFSACGGDYSSSYDDNIGSYACSIKWPVDVPTLESSSSVSKAINCSAADIETIVFTFYDEGGGYLIHDEFDCTLHEGTVNGIPAGTNRVLEVTGKDPTGKVLYLGLEANITINKGQITQGEEIQMVRSWTMLNLPDTGQITSYTATFGEDSDYSINPPTYTDNGNGTVTDNVSGLMWQQDEAGSADWGDAVNYCNNSTLAGYIDWRLPSKKELMSIVDYESHDPSIDITYFPGTISWYYWSSTTYASGWSNACFVNFSNGYVVNASKSASYYVRCVRGGQ